jgi:hypothetical protein
MRIVRKQLLWGCFFIRQKIGIKVRMVFVVILSILLAFNTINICFPVIKCYKYDGIIL